MTDLHCHATSHATTRHALDRGTAGALCDECWARHRALLLKLLRREGK